LIRTPAHPVVTFERQSTQPALSHASPASFQKALAMVKITTTTSQHEDAGDQVQLDLFLRWC
jgi:hypothetical protein